MKAVIEYDFEIEGESPSEEILYNAIWKLASDSGYIGSEEVDGTDSWGLEINNISVSIKGLNHETK